MFTLPDVQGRFPVGATTFAIPLRSPQIIGPAKLRRSSGNTAHEPALLLEEVVFTAFYPADIHSPNADGTPPEKLKKAMDWVPKPVHEAIRGYAHFAKLPFWFSDLFMGFVASRLKLPVYPNVPLLDPTVCLGDPEAQWPLVIFSHGLSGTRTTYSHLCIRLASQGKVVLAMEHRDGTAPVVTSHFASTGTNGKKRRRPKVKYYLHPEDVMYEDQSDPAKSGFRTDQLLFRRIEVYLAYRGLADLVNACPRPEAEKSLLNGIYIVHGYRCHAIQNHGPFWQSWTSGRIRFRDDVALVGHSFGGALVFSILSNPPPTLPDGNTDTSFEALPITHALVLDPWLEPLPTPGPAPHVEATRDARAPKILVINSEEFTLWNDHFARLEGVVRSWRQDITEPNASHGDAAQSAQVKLLTLVRARHVSFSDFSVIWPIGHFARDGRQILKVIGDLALAFLGDTLGDAVQALHKVQMDVERGTEVKSAPPGKRGRRIVGSVGDVIVH